MSQSFDIGFSSKILDVESRKRSDPHSWVYAFYSRNNEKILKAIAQEVHIDKKNAMRTI